MHGGIGRESGFFTSKVLVDQTSAPGEAVFFPAYRIAAATEDSDAAAHYGVIHGVSMQKSAEAIVAARAVKGRT